MFSELEHRPRPVLRWYRSTATALVLGRGQTRLQPATSLAVVARDSGGGAVLMDPSLLALDVLLPTGHPLLEGDPTQVFVRLGGAWMAALTELGVPALALHTGPAPPRRGDAYQQLRAGICYATVGRGEVTSGGRKLVGLSQRRRRWGALVQCGVLGRWDPRPLLAALGGDPDDAGIRSAAVGLAELGGPDDDRLIPAVERALNGYSLAS